MNLLFWKKSANISEPIITLNKELQIIDNWIPTCQRSLGYLRHVSKDLFICIHGESWMSSDEKKLITLTAHKTYEILWYNINNKAKQEKRIHTAKELGL